MGYIEAFILSLVEGITEFLPISSTGHLILVSTLLKIPESEFTKTFEIVIQSGAIASVVFLYGKSLVRNKEILKRVVYAFIPTALVGFLLYSVIKKFLLGSEGITLASLFIGGVLIIFIEKYFRKNEGKQKIINLTIKESILIGIIQSLSVIPGLSRSAASIYGGMFVGLSRKESVELSFFLAIPTMFMATAYDLIKTIDTIKTQEVQILIFGFICSFFIALASIKWFLSFIKTNTFITFGIYRIIIAVVLGIILYSQIINF